MANRTPPHGAQSVPITETHQLDAQSPYAPTTIAADQLAHSFHACVLHADGGVAPVQRLRARQSTRAVITSIIIQIATGAHRVSLGSVHPTRDFNFVDDTVAAFLVW